MSELRSCPFCGGKPRVDTGDTKVRISCTDCEASTWPRAHYADVLAAWNTRVLARRASAPAPVSTVLCEIAHPLGTPLPAPAPRMYTLEEAAKLLEKFDKTAAGILEDGGCIHNHNPVVCEVCKPFIEARAEYARLKGKERR